MKTYKGFDKNLQCRGFQYEVGKEYETDRAEVCKSGFHACKCPLDVWEFYPPSEGNRFCEVEQSGETKTDDMKTASTKIKIGAEIGIPGLVKAHVEWVRANTEGGSSNNETGACSAATNTGYRSAATNTGYRSAATNTGACSAATNTGYRSAATNTGYRSAATNTGNCSAATNTGYRSAATNTGACSAATNTGYCSAATNTGNCSAATNTGDHSAATNTGDHSAAEVKGEDSVAIVTGRDSKARGALGCWLVLTERDADYSIECVKAFRIDGNEYKADTWYELKNGKIKRVEEN